MATLRRRLTEGELERLGQYVVRGQSLDPMQAAAILHELVTLRERLAEITDDEMKALKRSRSWVPTDEGTYAA